MPEIEKKSNSEIKNIEEEEIKFGESLSYFFVTMAPNPLLILVGSFLMLFYTDIVGLNPIAIGTLFLLARVMDGISDPIMGFIIDKLPRTKMGRFRHILIGGTIIACINYILLWFGPVWVNSGKLVVAYVTYLLLGWTFDIMDIPKNSLLPAMTANNRERRKLSRLDSIGTTLSAVLVSFAAPVILAAGDRSMSAFTTLVLIITGSVLVFGVVGALGVKERVMPVESKNNHTFKEYIKIIFQRPVITALLSSLIFGVGSAIGVGIGVYFFTYVISDLALQGTVSLSNLAGLIPGILVSGFVIRKLGKKKTFIFVTISMIVALAIRWIDPTSVPLIFTSTILSGLFLGIFLPALVLIKADNIDFAELELDYRSEPAVNSIYSLSSKVGQGLGGAIPAYVLGLTGYIPNLEQQPAAVINWIILVTIGLPIIFYAISGLIMAFGYNLSEAKVEEIQNTLNQKRVEKSVSQE